MLAKETVRARLEDREHGISYTEFSLHAAAGLRLRAPRAARTAAGCSSAAPTSGATSPPASTSRAAWAGPRSIGLVSPLLTTASGAKFGKTAAGTSVWLDPAMTSPYRFYQYWINAEDADAERYLKLFTFLSLDGDRGRARRARRDRGKRVGQQRLAAEVDDAGCTATTPPARAARRLGGHLRRLARRACADADLEPLLRRRTLDRDARARSSTAGLRSWTCSCAVKLADSKGAARRLIAQGGVYVNNVRVDDAGAACSAPPISRPSRCCSCAPARRDFHMLVAR